MVSLYLYLLLSFLFSWFDTTRAQGDSTLWTSWVPLAVRSPYLSCWMDTTNTPFNASDVNGPSRPPSIWPLFMEGQVRIHDVKVNDQKINWHIDLWMGWSYSN